MIPNRFKTLPILVVNEALRYWLDTVALSKLSALVDRNI
jgi:hypothetical protein